MNFEIQALGGKLIGSRSALKTLDRLTTLLPNAKINFEVIPPPETKKAEFGSMPDFRDPVPETDSDEDDLQKEILKVQEKDYQDQLDKLTDSDEDDDDIMHDPDIQEMVENGEHTCHMFDAHCQACEDDEEDDDEDDITLADLKDQLEDNMTLAEIQKELVKVEATKKRLETIRLKKENYKNYENYEEKKEEEELHFESEAEYLRWDALRPFDEMTRQYPRAPDFEMGGIDHVPNF